MIKFLDWVFSSQHSEPGQVFSYRELPTWPQWLCWRFTGHDQDLRWSDKVTNTVGLRCRCGKVRNFCGPKIEPQEEK